MRADIAHNEGTGRLLALIALSVFLAVSIGPVGVSAVTVGTQDFYLPLPSNLTSPIFSDIYTSQKSTWPSQPMHYVVGITATVDNTTIYYDHWENGYTGGLSGDQVVTLNRGKTQVFRNDVPVLPRGTSTRYDGGDRLYVVGGPVQVMVSTFGSTTGTVFSDAWEVFPVQAWENYNVIPVGPTLAANSPGYNDFKTVWIQVMSGSDNNQVQVYSSTGTLLGSTTLARGAAYNLKLPTNVVPGRTSRPPIPSRSS